MVNMSVELGVAPSAWRRAVITPVPKCMPINGLSDLRPISVTVEDGGASGREGPHIPSNTDRAAF